MPAPKRTPKRSRTRERILDAAFELFCERGFAGTSISEIERRVGLAVGTGSLQYHFRTKEEVLLLAAEREVARCMAELDSARAGVDWPDDPHDQMVLAARLVLHNIRRFQGLFRLMQVEGERMPALRASFTAALYETGGLGAWAKDPSRLVAIAALAGYEQFVRTLDGPFADVTEDGFIAALVAVLPAGRPPGVDEQTYEAIRHRPAGRGAGDGM